MPETCENWLSLVNSCIYYACQTREIYQVLLYSVDYIWNDHKALFFFLIFDTGCLSWVQSVIYVNSLRPSDAYMRQ